mgnify:CR=1 FL=1
MNYGILKKNCMKGFFRWLMVEKKKSIALIIILLTIVVIFICGRYYFAHNKSYKNEAIDYVKWENFAKVIKRAMIACENSGHSIPDIQAGGC